MTGEEADAIARDIISNYGYGEYFGHSTGHGIGLEIHEKPMLAKTAKTKLELIYRLRFLYRLILLYKYPVLQLHNYLELILF